jgi:hypothetical protein
MAGIFGMSSFAAHALAGGAGAGIGAAVDKKNREQGAIIGAGVGVAATSGYKIFTNYKASPLRHLPGKGLIATAAITGAALGIGAMLTPSEYQRASVAKPDETGSGYTPEIKYDNYKYSLSDRTASMNVSGDLVFGLYKLRHG